MDNRKIRVLVFEDEPNRFRILVEGIFTDRTRQEREIRWSRDGIELKDENEKFIKKMEDNDLLEGEVDLILVDIKMGPETPKYGKYGGILILERIFGLRNHCRSVVATSGYIDDIKKDHPDAQKAVEELEQKEDLIIIDRKITQANANDYALLRQIIASRKGRNLLTPQIERQILLLGRTNDPVLILGATGTGKEGIATSIHKAWCEHTHNGEKRPFLSLNAGALQYDLMRSELFGYAQGAYTGALQTGAVGIAFQSCGIKEWKELKGKDSLPGSTNFQGTLFFDEIGNTDLGCQGLLLRFLERPFAAAPVASPEIHNVRPRIIAATNSPEWLEFARSGSPGTSLRSDLFGRIARHIIFVPDLVSQDVEGIIRMVADIRWEPAAIDYVTELFEDKAIRGNIRGLINFIKRAELIVQKGSDLGWKFRTVDKKVVELTIAQSQGIGIATKSILTHGQEESSFVTPMGNTVNRENLKWAFDYALGCERKKPVKDKDLPGSLLSKYGQTKAEMLFLLWFSIYRNENKPKNRKLEEFKNEGASKWFASASPGMAHRTIQKTAKTVLSLNSIKEISDKAEQFRKWCIKNKLWPQEFS